MKIGVLKQMRPGETRAPLVPAVVKRLTEAGHAVRVESGTGAAAFSPDEAFREAGAEVVVSADEAVRDADAVVTIEPPGVEVVRAMQGDAVLIGMLAPARTVDPSLLAACHESGVTAFSLELLPRTSRAQAMDVLSSQANIAGYKAALLAADAAAKIYPMMITAAGTLSPAKVVVLGAGVAGLQAIATARRLGAQVEANDVRAATKEQVQSLGARFIDLPGVEQADAATGGYATELTDEQKAKQREVLAARMAGADAVIATAAVPGKPPPLLIPADVVERMQPGSVIVDLGASPEHGRGNCELTRPGEVYLTDGGITIIGTLNLPALVPAHASQAYAHNMLAFLKELTGEGGSLAVNPEDELQAGCCVTRG